MEFTIAVEQLVSDAQLDHDDLMDKNKIVGKHVIIATDPEHALDLFHQSVAIACLEDFSIEVEP